MSFGKRLRMMYQTLGTVSTNHFKLTLNCNYQESSKFLRTMQHCVYFHQPFWRTYLDLFCRRFGVRSGSTKVVAISFDKWKKMGPTWGQLGPNFEELGPDEEHNARQNVWTGLNCKALQFIHNVC